MSKRTDPHRPSALKTEDYRFLAFYACIPGDPIAQAAIMAEHRRCVQRHLEAGGKGFARNPSAGECYCCGSVHNEGITCVYLPTQELVKFGHTCGGHVSGMDDGAFRRFARTAAEARERVAGYAKLQVTLADRGIDGLYDWFRANENGMADDREDFYHDKMVTLLDMCRKLVRYGDISEKAWGYLLKCWGWTQEAPAKRAERAVKREAEKAQLADVEPGRRVIEGEVVSIKFYENDYGETKKILVNCGDFKVFVTCPAAIYEAAKGNKVRFNVTLQPKERGFAIGSRPAKAEILATV